MNATEDTIAAITTPPGEAGIAIVRVSGPDALALADRVFRGSGKKPSQRASHVLVHGHVADQTGNVDEVLMLIMRAPHTYTREDVVELQGHGGAVCARRILRAVLEAGARPAEPGEFTCRAFLNGRIDLLQAEAVLDLIRARSERAAAAALEQLEGGLSRTFNTLYDELLRIAADFEATLDFPEEDLPEYVLPQLTDRLDQLSQQFSRLLETWEEGHMLRDGVLIVISGKPNVGKSTMLNALLERQRAIVSHIPGTTRDTIEEGFILGGVPVRLVDTAGLRESGCEVEQEGVQRTRNHMMQADFHLYVVDASRELEADVREHILGLNKDRCILVLNKIDIAQIVRIEEFAEYSSVETSMTEGLGLDGLKQALLEKLQSTADLTSRPHAVINERHRKLLQDAQTEIQAAGELMRSGSEEAVVPAISRLRSALDGLGAATGRVYEEELLDHIFSRFCIGK